MAVTERLYRLETGQQGSLMDAHLEGKLTFVEQSSHHLKRWVWQA
jgi:hypothetical protein